MRFKASFIILLLIVAGCKGIHDIPDTDAPLEQRLEQYLDECEEEGFTGSVLISVGDTVVVSSGYGYNSEDEAVKNSNETIYDIGSVTKQFTAAAILQLEMNGELNVSDEAGKYITELNDEKSKLTIHQLLTHTSGLTVGLGLDTELISTADFLTKVNDSELEETPGEEYSYSNVGYSLLGMIIEIISEKTYETYMQEHIFLPAGMNSTGYVLPDWSDKNMAFGYEDSELPTDKNWNEEGPGWHLKANGGILSNVEDMYLWHQALLDETILNEAAKTKLYGRYVKKNRAGSIHYAYGWNIINTRRDTDLITHNGGNHIFYTEFWRFLEENVTILILSNRDNLYSQKIGEQINNIIFPE